MQCKRKVKAGVLRKFLSLIEEEYHQVVDNSTRAKKTTKKGYYSNMFHVLISKTKISSFILYPYP